MEAKSKRKRNIEDSSFKYYLNASFLNKDEEKHPGFYKKDEEGKMCYAFTKNIEYRQFDGKPQMTCTFGISYLPKLYKFMMDNTKVKVKVFERVYKLSKQILNYSKKMPSVQACYDKYQGIIIYLLSYYFSRESWKKVWKEDEPVYFKSLFYFKTRTNPILLLKIQDCYTILVENLKQIKDFENIVIFFEKCFGSIETVIYVKGHPIIIDRYFKLPEQKILDKIGKDKYTVQEYCNPSSIGENDLGEISLDGYDNLLFDRFSVEVFDWPPNDLGAEYISIEFRDLLGMFYLAVSEDEIEYDFREEKDKKQEYMVEQNTLTEEDEMLLDGFIELYTDGYDMCSCEDFYTLIKHLFRVIIFPIFKGEKHFQFGIEFETNLLQCNFEHHDRKKIWGEEKVTVTSETMSTYKNHLPKDGKYYDCVSNVYEIPESDNVLCVYSLEGQVGIFTFDLDKNYPVYNLDEFKRNMGILCNYINKQVEDKTVFVEDDFDCEDVEEFRDSKKYKQLQQSPPEEYTHPSTDSPSPVSDPSTHLSPSPVSDPPSSPNPFSTDFTWAFKQNKNKKSIKSPKRGSARVQRLKSPVGQKKSPVGRKKSPVGRKKSPVGRKKSPVGRKKSPVARKKSPVARKKSPVGRKKSPVGRKKSPVGQKKSHKNK